MRLSFKYRLYPNNIQSKALNNIFYAARSLYNGALQERIAFYRKTGKSLSYNKQAAELPEITDNLTDYNKIHSQILQQTLKQLDSAYKNFFRRVKNSSDKPGFPRFKGADRFRSICFPQVKFDLSGSGGVKRLPNDKLKIFGIPGEIKIIWHRPLQGRAKTFQIIKQANCWYAVISCDAIEKKPLPKTGKTSAFDIGLTAFLTMDDGTKFHHPKPWRTAKEKLAEKQRILAAKQRGSLNRRRAKTALQAANQKVVNIRQDFQHKLANKLIAENDVIILEKLEVQKLLQKGHKNLHIGISDAAWSNFVAILTYKAESAGRIVIFVDPRNTSKMCSACGMIKKDLTLMDRTYRCGHCKFEMDRDQNAAINIRRLGMSHVISES